MQLISSSVVVVAASIAVQAATASRFFAINTPVDVKQCVPTKFTWSGGKPPYFMSILPGLSAPGGIAIEEFGGLKGHSFTWSTNVAAGQLLEVELTDSTGSDVFTSPFEVMPSGNSSCL